MTKYIICIQDNETKNLIICFTTKTALKSWIKKEELIFDNWIFEGKKTISEFNLIKNDDNEKNIIYNISYNIPLKNKNDVLK